MSLANVPRLLLEVSRIRGLVVYLLLVVLLLLPLLHLALEYQGNQITRWV